MEIRKLKVSNTDMIIIESFMSYQKGVLSEWITWNEIMPVIEKITRIEYDRQEQDLPDGGKETIIHTAYPVTFGMINHETGNPMFRFNQCCLFEAPTLIEAAWMAVVDFIKMEQEQTPTNDSK